MDLAWISLAALIVVIVVSCTTTVNPGLLAIALAWVIGVYIAPACGASFGFKDVLAGFPSELFLTLVGATLLFAQAQVNGTLAQVSRVAVGCCRGNVGSIPVMFFLLAFVLAAVGAGSIAATALMAPMAMAVAQRVGVSPFLMAIMVAHGALAGALSPFSPTGIVANSLMRDKIGLSGFEGQTFGYNLLANAIVAAGGYLVLGGSKLFSKTFVDASSSETNVEAPMSATQSDEELSTTLQPRHWATLCVIGGLIAAVIFGGCHVGMGAITAAVILTLARLTDEQKAIRSLPWGVIVMVCGVTVLTALLERTGGIDRFAELISRVSGRRTIVPVLAFVTGAVSVYSSTSGVVLPALLPMVPKLMTQLDGGDPLPVALSILVGGNLVDSSPLSTIGALCIASASATVDRRALFNKLLIWGLSMAVAGAGLCYLLFG